jgi:hypothetical protein
VRVAVVLLASWLVCGCEKPPPEPSPAVKPATPQATRPGAALILGTWQVDGFEASSVAGATSAAALQAQADSPEAQAVRITYTEKQVQIQAPGQAVMSSGYDVLESKVGYVRIQNGKDLVVISFRDDDHMTIDRRGNAFGAKMKMKRATGPAPSMALGSGSIATPFGSAKIVGTNAAGHQIVKIGGN